MVLTESLIQGADSGYAFPLLGRWFVVLSEHAYRQMKNAPG
jgi:hypothetical protein